MAPLFLDAKVYFLVFAFITALGGVMGYVKAASVPSLIAGVAAGALLALGALLIPRAWQTGAVIDLVVSLLLAARFVPSLIQRKLNPAIYVVPLAIIGVILAAMLLFSPGAHP